MWWIADCPGERTSFTVQGKGPQPEGAGLGPESDRVPWEQELNGSGGLSTLTYAPSWLRFPAPRLAGPFAILPWEAPVLTGAVPVLPLAAVLPWPPGHSSFPCAPYWLSLPTSPLTPLGSTNRQWTWENCSVSAHVPNDLDSTLNIWLYSLSRVFSSSLRLSTHLSACLILRLHFIGSGRH